MKLIRIDGNTAEDIVPLIAEFRVVLSSYKGIDAEPNLEWAREEIQEFLERDYPVYAAVHEGGVAGYMVCRIDDFCLWVEHIYVRKEYRRKGAASMLFAKAEDIAGSMGGDTVFNFVHPNNEGMIAFLRSKGYTVLNMIEIRKPYEGEKLTTTVKVNDTVFDY